MLSRTDGGDSACEPVPGHRGQGHRRIQYCPNATLVRCPMRAGAAKADLRSAGSAEVAGGEGGALVAEFDEAGAGAAEIGRASCRERV